jgi:uncharacterized protein (DUF1330 family)
MSAYLVVDLTPKNTDKLQAYSAAAAETIAAFGGKFLAKGPFETFHGDALHKMKAIIEFPDSDAVHNWYNSDAYQALVALRDEGMDSQFHLLG